MGQVMCARRVMFALGARDVFPCGNDKVAFCNAKGNYYMRDVEGAVPYKKDAIFICGRQIAAPTRWTRFCVGADSIRPRRSAEKGEKYQAFGLIKKAPERVLF